MNFNFDWLKQYFTNEGCVCVKYCFSPRESKIHIIKPPCNFFFSYIDKSVEHFSSSLPAQTLSPTAVVRRQEFLEVLSFRIHL